MLKPPSLPLPNTFKPSRLFRKFSTVNTVIQFACVVTIHYSDVWPPGTRRSPAGARHFGLEGARSLKVGGTSLRRVVEGVREEGILRPVRSEAGGMGARREVKGNGRGKWWRAESDTQGGG